VLPGQYQQQHLPPQGQSTVASSLDPTLTSHHPPLLKSEAEYHTTIDPALQFTAGAVATTLDTNSNAARLDQNHTNSPHHHHHHHHHRDAPPLH
jgi:hypothetical protein